MSTPQPYPGSPIQSYPNGKPMFDVTGRPASPKSRLAALLLLLIIGLGLHRFYVGKIGTGILFLVTLGGLGIWWLVDLVMIIIGTFTDKQGRVVANW
ncbi:MAG: TM2 domain-containing protein [Candidatus Nanopelagicales bacterium]|jgi:hypothetical protein|nr:TM2 domain-containing protein [Candidatus Nanopelagicales bacterium]